jgi:hypothetical protein
LSTYWIDRAARVVSILLPYEEGVMVLQAAKCPMREWGVRDRVTSDQLQTRLIKTFGKDEELLNE